MAASFPLTVCFELSDAPVSETSAGPFPDSLGPFMLGPCLQIRPEQLKLDVRGSSFTMRFSDLSTSLQTEVKPLFDEVIMGRLAGLQPIGDDTAQLRELGVPFNAFQKAWGATTKSPSDSGAISSSRGNPDLNFLLTGGFIYFDQSGSVVHITALMLAHTDKGRMMSTLRFSGPKPWNTSWTAPLEQLGRWFPVTSKVLRAAGATKYCWMSAGEAVGDGTEQGGVAVLPRGGFVYMFEDADKLRPGFVEAMEYLDQCSAVKQVFKAFDRNGDGQLDVQELKGVMRFLDGDMWTAPVVEKLLASCDQNVDGRVNMEEFISWLFGNGAKLKMPDAAPQGASGDPVGADLVTAFNRDVTVASIIGQLPADKKRICILGGRAFSDPTSELLIKALAPLIARDLADKVVVMTGGMPGVQETFAKSAGPSLDQFHLLPEGQQSNFGVGRDLVCGRNMEERMVVFGEAGDIYLCVEGGPGVAKEASAAFKRGAYVVPMMWTGGASSGLFDFPAACLERPRFCTEEEWTQLREKGTKEPQELAQATAAVVAKVIANLVG